MKRLLLLTLLLTCLTLGSLGRSLAISMPSDVIETLRIRVANEVDGAVQVSVDQGKSWSIVGRVVHPATACVQGFAASAFAQDGRVAAIAVHALRIRAGSIHMRDGDVPQVFSLIPKEFAKPGGDFGTGEVAGASGIYTDIPAGTAIFRNLSPLVGNPVFIERFGVLRPLPADYVPSPGDTIVIIAQVHARRPSEILIENRRGGSVEAVYGDSKEQIAVVEHPVLGIGRFDATEYTGVGCINTNHTGVVTVSTSPIVGRANGGQEPRGGFQILPSKHADHIGRIPQYMVVGPATKDSPALEGSPMLFSDYIGLAYDPGSPKDTLRVDVQVGGSDWQPLAVLVGKQNDALEDYGGSGQPITRIRFRFPEHSEDWEARQLRVAADTYVRTKYGSKPPARGILSFSLQMNGSQEAKFASLFIDGGFRGISNSAPFTFSVDVDKLPPGEHSVEIRASDGAGVVLKSTRQWFYTVESDARVAGNGA